MSWALLAAGCPRAVVTQTDVPESTSELMITFHRELAGRLTRGGAFDPRAATEASRDAQLSMLRNKRLRGALPLGRFHPHRPGLVSATLTAIAMAKTTSSWCGHSSTSVSTRPGSHRVMSTLSATPRGYQGTSPPAPHAECNR